MWVGKGHSGRILAGGVGEGQCGEVRVGRSGPRGTGWAALEDVRNECVLKLEEGRHGGRACRCERIRKTSACWSVVCCFVVIWILKQSAGC